MPDLTHNTPNLTEEMFFEKLVQNIKNLPIYKQSGRRLQNRKRTDNNIPAVYSANNVLNLCNGLDKDSPLIRYVIDKNKVPKFGSQGPLKGSTPGHDEMSDGICLAAGMLELSKDKTTVEGVSYRSGYFKPDLSSLIWILSYLVSEQSVFKLSKKLNISYIPIQSKTPDWEILSINVQALKNFLATAPLASTTSTEDGMTELYSTYPEEAPIERVSSYENIAHLVEPFVSPVLSTTYPNHIEENSEENSPPHLPEGRKRKYDLSFLNYMSGSNASSSQLNFDLNEVWYDGDYDEKATENFCSSINSSSR